MHCAVLSGCSKRIIQFLYDHGCPLDALNDDGCAAVHLASEQIEHHGTSFSMRLVSGNALAVVKLLRKLGARMDIVSPEYGSAVDMAHARDATDLEAKLAKYSSHCEKCEKPRGAGHLSRCSGGCENTYYCSTAP
jgi:hypothetical protein